MRRQLHNGQSKSGNKKAKTQGATDPKQSGIFAPFFDAGRKVQHNALNHAIVRLICAAALPPAIADRPEFKKIFELTVPSYTPPSSSKLSNSLIPSEASFVRGKQLEFLKAQTHLTISFDGATIRRPQSIYTVHIWTPDRRVFLVEGHEASGESHTAEHILELLCTVSRCFPIARSRTDKAL
jgi:hypothetical protein